MRRIANRKKTCQHVRRLKSGKKILVNKGTAPRKKRSMSKVKSLSEEERDYIVETFDREPEDMYQYDIDDIISERRENSKRRANKVVRSSMYDYKDDPRVLDGEISDDRLARLNKK